MMRRSSTYAAVSTALATAVTSYAFIERPNFYSAAVYLSHSSACLIILSNAALVYFAGLMYGLQRLLFGTLRPIEIEQLWERGWIAGTEWLFALSIFRDDFGVTYLASFILLFVSKVWGWMVDGRLDILEQQNPANATRFHTRLMVATALNVLLPLKMVSYCFDEAMYGPKSGIMTMFTFEFGILLIGAVSTTLRYGLWYHEYRVIQRQLTTRLEEIRREAEESGDPVLPEDDFDVHDLDLPGWEAKSSFQFALDIGTDFLKLAAYLTFFGVLTVLYGLPIYIVRDLYMTGRSFYNRVNDYRQYRNATHNMHTQYADASVESLTSDNTCIVCREDMKPWIGIIPADEQAANRASGNYATNERQRPKQLPCGHILHFSCLRSWLERQQACPICRRSVLRPGGRSPTTTTPAPVNDANRAAQGPPDVPDGQPRQVPAPAPLRDNHVPHHGRAAAPMRRFGFRLGPFRFSFGRLDGQEALDRFRQAAAAERPEQAPLQMQQQPPTVLRQGVVPAAFVPRPNNVPATAADGHSAAITSLANTSEFEQVDGGQLFARSLQAHALHSHLTALEHMIRQDVQSLNLAEQRVQCIQWLLSELERARAEVHAHQAHIQPIPVFERRFGDAGSSQPTATTASQAILDPSGHVLTTLPDGWNVVPLNAVAFNLAHASEGANEATATSTLNVPTTVTPIPNGQPFDSDNGQSLRQENVQQVDPQHATSKNDSKSIGVATGLRDTTSATNSSSGAEGVKSELPGSQTATRTAAMGAAPSWSFDGVPVNTDGRKAPDESRSDGSATSSHREQKLPASLSSRSTDKAHQPTIEESQDEDLQ